MRILVIEDNRDILANVLDYLQLKGFGVDCAQDGLSGLHLASTGHYDLIVLDIMLPGIDGYQVCKRLREDGQSEVPILMLTSRRTTAGLFCINTANSFRPMGFSLSGRPARLTCNVSKS